MSGLDIRRLSVAVAMRWSGFAKALSLTLVGPASGDYETKNFSLVYYYCSFAATVITCYLRATFRHYCLCGDSNCLCEDLLKLFYVIYS